MGNKACDGANIGSVFESCNGGSSCLNAGRSGQINSMQGSCNGVQACEKAAAYGGYIGDIIGKLS